MMSSHHFARGLALLAVAATLAGCAALGGTEHYPKRYTLDTGAAETAGTNAPSTGYTLDLRPVSAPKWLNSKRMLYRLDYTDDARLAAYTRSSWADTPARLVGQNLGDALSASGLFAAVLDHTAGRADLALKVDLSDFSQHFAAAHNSRGRISATATLVRADNGEVIAQKRFESTAPAPSANAVGGVSALTRADTQLDHDIRRWLASTLANCGSACPKPGGG